MPSVVSLRWRYGASRLCHFCGGDAYVWGCGGFRHAVGGVAGNFVVVVGNLGIYGHSAYSAPCVVGFGQLVGQLCGLVVGLHSQYGGKNKKKRIQDTI